MRTWSCEVLSLDMRIAVADNETILTAALRHGVPLSFGCSVGDCGACKLAVIAGEVEQTGPISEATLGFDERALGTVLACRSTPKGNVTVLPLRDDRFVFHRERDMRSHIVEVKALADRMTALELVPEDDVPFAYSPGQYAWLGDDGETPRKVFFSSTIPARRVLFHVPEPCELRTGDNVRVRGPFGRAFLRERHAGPVILAGEGPGRVAIFAILNALAMRRPGRDLIVYVDHDRYSSACIADARKRQPQLRSYRAGDIVDHSWTLCGWKAYVAGPAAFVDRIVGVLRGRGLDLAHVHAETSG